MGKVLLHFSRASYVDMEILDLCLSCQGDLGKESFPHTWISWQSSNSISTSWETKRNKTHLLSLGLHVCWSVIEGISWDSRDRDYSRFGYLFVNQCTGVLWAPSNSHCFLPVIFGSWPISPLTWLGAHRGTIGRCPFCGPKASIELKGQLSHHLIQPPWFSY